MSTRSIFKVRHPFVWSLVCSGLSLLFIEAGVLLFRQGLRRAGFLFALAGLLFLVLEVVIFLPPLVRNALRSTGIAFLFKITTSGFLYILLILLISIAAVNTGNNLLYILLASLDVIFTWTILHAGGQELNVIADWVIRRYDRVGVVVFKFLTLVLVVIICETVGRRDRALGQKLAYWAVALTAFPVVVGMVHLLSALRARTEP